MSSEQTANPSDQIDGDDNDNDNDNDNENENDNETELLKKNEPDSTENIQDEEEREESLPNESPPKANRVQTYSAVEMGINDKDNDDDKSEDDDKDNGGKTATIENNKDDDNNSNLTFVEAIKDVILSFWPLGLVAFGGPTAHVAILHERFVEKKKWLDDERFLELLAVGQGLPGPTSTQMVISCGAYKGGILGGLLSFLFWNLPSFIVLTLSGLGVSEFVGDETPYWMRGLPAAAVSLVFVAAFKLSKKVIDSKLKIALCILSTVIVLLLLGDSRVNAREVAIAYPILIFMGGCFTYIDSKYLGEKRSKLYDKIREKSSKQRIITRLPYMNKYTSIFLILFWIVILLTFVSLRGSNYFPSNSIALLFESFFRIGSIIYGGGQVVLPMLLTEVVDPGWVTEDEFWAGFALVQALPGPLFNFSAYLGAVGFGIQGAFIGWLGLFGPGLLLIFAFLPLWDYIHSIQGFRVFLQGVNATAIGLVIAACVVLWNGAIHNLASASVAVITASMVGFLNVPAPFAIIIGGFIGWMLTEQVAGIAQDDLCA